MRKDQAVTGKLSPGDLRQDEGVFLVDVRTPGEFEEKHIAGARLHPLHALQPEQLREAAADRRICLVCQSGNRAQQAAKKLADAGFEKVVVLDGGVRAWEEAGLPLQRGRKSISLERQVRIAAGSLVVLGVIGGAVLHPGLFVLSGFVGAGLIFAGVTDWCGMGLLLARMPWNQRKRSCCAGGD